MRIVAFICIVCAWSGCREIPPPPVAAADAGSADMDTGQADSAEAGQCIQEPTCDGDAVVTCQDGIETRVECGQDMTCDQGVCVTTNCEPGRSVCDGDDVLSCPPAGGQPTRIVCNDTAPCQTSPNGCGCRQGQCEERICLPGGSRCVQVGPQACAEDGFSWERATECEEDEVCAEGMCAALVCQAGDARCTGDTLEICNRYGTGYEATDCTTGEFFCSEDPSPHCEQWLCNPGTTECSQDRRSVLTCDNRGAGQDSTPCIQGEHCDTGVCVPRLCEPNAIFCRNGDVHLCNGDGSDSTLESDCQDGVQACNQGLCRNIICQAGLATCDDELLTVCNDSGTEQTQMLCSDQDAFCDADQGTCTPWVCPPGEGPRCNNNTVTICDERGTVLEVVQTCVDEQVCEDAVCRDPVCEPGVIECQEDVLEVCANNGLDQTEQDCTALGAYCDPQLRECVDWVCTPGQERRCEDGDVQGCDDRGTGFELREQCENRGCEQGQCVRLGDGEECDDDDDCESRNCSQEICTPEEFSYIRAGSFDMGSPDGEPGRSNQEGPIHRVQVTRAMWVMRTEVSQRQWATLMRNNPSQNRGNSLRPVEMVSWFDVLAYSNARSRNEDLPECYDLGDCTGTPGTGGFTCPEPPDFSLDCQGYRLPTEAEWEYFARAGTRTAFHTGDITITDCEDEPNLLTIGWYCGNSDSVSHPIAEKQTNPWGLYDTAGNVFEWVWDWFDSDYYEDSPGQDPIGPDTGNGRVIRGGGWNFQARGARSAFRLRLSPDSQQGYLGFRLVRTLPR